MGKLLAVLFGAIALSAVIGLDYRSYTLTRDEAIARGEAAPPGYVAALTARIEPWINPVPERTLVDLLPPAPEGWTRRPYEMADGSAITGEPYAQYATPTDTATTLLQRLSLERREPSRMADTYISGDGRMIVVRLEYRGPDRTPSAAAKLALRDFAKTRAEDLAAATPFYEGGGMVLSAAPLLNTPMADGPSVETDWRRLIASPSERLDMDVLTNMGDDRLLSFLIQMDLSGIAKLATQDTAPDGATATAPEAVHSSSATPCIRRAGALVCG